MLKAFQSVQQFRLSLEITLLGLLASYQILAFYLADRLGTSIAIPCLFTLLTGHHCWGCGLSRALWSLVQGEFLAAYFYNPAIYLLLGFFIYRGIKLYLSVNQYIRPS
jgi:hypothetical protein